MPLWNEQLTEEECKSLIDKTADKIVRKRMSVPAVIFLEMHKPVAYIAAHGAIAFSPVLAPFFGLDNVDKYTQFFSERKNVEALIQRIEDLETEWDSKEREKKDVAR